MRRIARRLSIFSTFLVAGCLLGGLPRLGAQGRALTFEDVMRFQAIQDPVVSRDGRWLAYQAKPDRGDGELMVHSLQDGQVFRQERGSRPTFSRDSRWLAAVLEPPLREQEKPQGKNPPPKGLLLLNLESGTWTRFEEVKEHRFSDDSRYLLYLRQPSREAESGEKAQGKARDEKKVPAALRIRQLETGAEEEVEGVLRWALQPASLYLACVRRGEGGKQSVEILQLSSPHSPRTLEQAEGEEAEYGGLVWDEEGSRLAYLSRTSPRQPGELVFWEVEGARRRPAVLDGLPPGWGIPIQNSLQWSRDGRRLFLGLRPLTEEEPEASREEEKEEAPDPLDVHALLQRREVDIWHWNDPFIVPHQKRLWPRLKEQTYRAVYHLEEDRLVPLADPDLPQVEVVENDRTALGLSDVPYRKEVTWDGRYHDVYLVDLTNGSRLKAIERLPASASNLALSPSGRYLLYFESGHWWLLDQEKPSRLNLTENLGVPFANEDHDYPSQPPGYGHAGWVEDDAAVLFYDKYDIWKVDPSQGLPVCLTQGRGRQAGLSFRIERMDPDRKTWKKNEKLLLEATSEKEKYTVFYQAHLDRPGLRPLLEEPKRFRFRLKAKEADVLLYTRESYDEFPDLWVSNSDLESPRRVTDLNSQMKDFAWGKAELVEWNSLDGIPLQGVLIKPGNYQPGRRYPVIVYFYRFFSQRLHEFNQPVINHRPAFALYASHGYALFLPDIRFEVGRPGLAATKSLLPGVQKLIDLGIADPERIGLHGHSWSGYQTAFIITQTNLFAAAVAGAPVSNMTSAYSGIRWGTGLARQFQYEKSQSRIGGSLWEYPERYIENSPVFFADRIQTPLLIQFGDEDGAVPWYQGIELYLAMRRLGKNCIFLQYRGEPHHLQKYPNKLDYAIKMKEYFDHYLMGKPAPSWMVEGVPYRGR